MRNGNVRQNVSIIMPVYNAERFIDEAIDSVISQTYFDWELLIVDDCSTDKSSTIVKNYLRNDSRIRYLNCLLYTSDAADD